MWTTPIPELSAGNQRRAQIAVALSAAPAILIIDEPTNYLDLITVQALEEALTEWKGTLVIAIHDQWLINHWQGRRIHTR
ncbi:ATP-binding cassette domain-containing protein [Trueperella pyogenes]|nr:ATP-binding cassette domain-containing protein [Trueperella pyogenes]